MKTGAARQVKGCEARFSPVVDVIWPGRASNGIMRQTAVVAVRDQFTTIVSRERGCQPLPVMGKQMKFQSDPGWPQYEVERLRAIVSTEGRA